MNFALALLVLTAIALVGGSIWLRLRGGPTKQIVLMLVLALVIVANIAIWTLPDANGDALVNAAPPEVD